jgi:hypothetical protein
MPRRACSSRDPLDHEILAFVLADDASNFRLAMSHCANLVAVHRGPGDAAQGRRYREVSINRAIIVMTVAAWQAAIQDMVETTVISSQPPAGSLMSNYYNLVAGRVRSEVGHFSTPNGENTRNLMKAAGFDPYPHWTWSQMGGKAVGKITVRPHHANNRIASWLRVRHDIAHGHSVISSVDVLEAVRQNPNPTNGWQPTIRLVDAEQCMAFFRRLCQLTAAALGAQLTQPPGVWTT